MDDENYFPQEQFYHRMKVYTRFPFIARAPRKRTPGRMGKLGRATPLDSRVRDDSYDDYHAAMMMTR